MSKHVRTRLIANVGITSMAVLADDNLKQRIALMTTQRVDRISSNFFMTGGKGKCLRGLPTTTNLIELRTVLNN